ncbi:MAG: hypothetical protein ACFB9N_10715 [Geitlerinemataceae cyanobacterium]
MHEFKEHLLKQRLKRLKKSELYQYWGDFLGIKKSDTLDEMVEKIVGNYFIKKTNQDFLREFNLFLRDSVCSARDADYIFKVEDTKKLQEWLGSWTRNKYIGNSHTFSLHKIIELSPEKASLCPGEGEQVSHFPYPDKILFVISQSQKDYYVTSGFDQLAYKKTNEIEVVIRSEVNLVELRGPYKIVKDLIQAAYKDRIPSWRSAVNLQVISRSSQSESILKYKMRLSITRLKELLVANYRKLTSSFSGDKVSAVSLDLEDFQDISEETHPAAQSVLAEALEDPSSGTLEFKYQDKRYRFWVNQTGGFTFKQYMPEEVVTYIMSKINLMYKDEREKVSSRESDTQLHTE